MDVRLDRRSLLGGAFGAAAFLADPASARQCAEPSFFKRISRPIGLQLYTLGDEPRTDLEGTLRRVAAIGFRDIELPSLLGFEPAAIRKAADSAGLTISSMHIPASGDLSIGSSIQRLVDLFGAIGAKQLVVPMFPIPAGFKVLPGESLSAALVRAVQAQGHDMWRSLADVLNARATLLRPHRIKVGYHNHSIEFMPIGTRTGWDILASATDPRLIHFEADIGWLTSAGVDPIGFLKTHEGRVRQVHVKDVQRGFKPTTAMRTSPTEVGSGSVDWSRVLPAAYEAGVRNFYVEQEPPFAFPRMVSATRSFEFLAKLRAKPL